MLCNIYLALEQSNKLGNAKSRVWEIFPTYTVQIHGRVREENTHRGLHGLMHGPEARPCVGAKLGSEEYTVQVHGRVSPLFQPCVSQIHPVEYTAQTHARVSQPCMTTVCAIPLFLKNKSVPSLIHVISLFLNTNEV